MPGVHANIVSLSWGNLHIFKFWHSEYSGKQSSMDTKDWQEWRELIMWRGDLMLHLHHNQDWKKFVFQLLQRLKNIFNSIERVLLFY